MLNILSGKSNSQSKKVGLRQLKQRDLTAEQVKKVLSGIDQRLILMVRG